MGNDWGKVGVRRRASDWIAGENWGTTLKHTKTLTNRTNKKQQDSHSIFSNCYQTPRIDFVLPARHIPLRKSVTVLILTNHSSFLQISDFHIVVLHLTSKDGLQERMMGIILYSSDSIHRSADREYNSCSQLFFYNWKQFPEPGSIPLLAFGFSSIVSIVTKLHWLICAFHCVSLCLLSVSYFQHKGAGTSTRIGIWESVARTKINFKLGLTKEKQW